MEAVWGRVTEANRRVSHIDYGSYGLRTLKGQPYIEAGTGLDNIFKVFRVDLVWRFAPPIVTPAGVPPPTTQNSHTNFGIFGSFHFQL